MRHSTKVRAAIFTSMGLLPLACAGHATDSNDPLGDGRDGDGQRPQLSDCGSDTAVPAELMGVLHQVRNSVRVLTAGIESGTYRCESGVLHRPEPVTCQSRLPRPLPPAAASGSAQSQVEFLYSQPADPRAQCAADADCTARPLGYCGPTFQGGPFSYDVACSYGCLADEECGEGYLCECGDPVGHCVQAQCQSDQDCPGTLKCATWFTDGGCSRDQIYRCQTALDECNAAADCAEGTCRDGACVVDRPTTCGRPFLVQGEARLAAVVGSTDWSARAGGAGRPLELSSRQAQAVGEYWTRAALMEHASIAAFARFTLQLMHLGAPLELIEGSQRAMLDETCHATACFELASRYLGKPVGPGRLPMLGALQDIDLEQIVRMAFREGCVGETVATLEAGEACDGATDPLVQQVLSRIAVDELKHAELAWRFVCWALELGVPAVRQVLTAELERLEAEAGERLPSTDPADESGHGVLSPATQAKIRRVALLDVVLPCARRLLSPARSPGRQPVASLPGELVESSA